jgi:hypothetical protein
VPGLSRRCGDGVGVCGSRAVLVPDFRAQRVVDRQAGINKKGWYGWDPPPPSLRRDRLYATQGTYGCKRFTRTANYFTVFVIFWPSLVSFTVQPNSAIF